MTNWHLGGKATYVLADTVLKMEIDLPKQLIYFYRNDELVGETVITNYLMEKELTPYISCKHQGDKFLINVE